MLEELEKLKGNESLKGKILFTSQCWIWIMNRDGSNATALVRGSDPDVSPDGKLIAFSYGAVPLSWEGYYIGCGGVGNRGIHIFVISATGGRIFKITTDKATIQTEPRWSPDGSKIVYTATVLNPYPTDEHYIEVIDLREGTVKRLAEGMSPAWSPDGKQIAFCKPKEGGGGEIWIMNSDGTNQHKIVEGFDPDWSPDGKRLVFTSSSWPLRIGVVNIDGTNLTWLTYPSGIDAWKDQEPKWSPDGRYIVFQSTKCGNWDIFVIDLLTGAITQLTDSPEHETHPCWG